MGLWTWAERRHLPGFLFWGAWVGFQFSVPDSTQHSTAGLQLLSGSTHVTQLEQGWLGILLLLGNLGKGLLVPTDHDLRSALCPRLVTFNPAAVSFP